jgi:CRISPR-associated protein Cas5d
VTADYPALEVRVWGDFACFTRPEMKVERVSYPVPTPSAARGILEAIFWKPQFKWRVEEIWVLNPIRYFSILRNEVNSKASRRSAARWEKHGGHYIADEDRTPRHTLALRDVDYVIRAHVDLQPGVRDHPAKYRDQFRRRVSKGRCFSRPYLGCREFAAQFAEPNGDERPIDWSEGIGRMLYDLEYRDDGSGTPVFFRARLEGGVLHVPPPPWKEG